MGELEDLEVEEPLAKEEVVVGYLSSLEGVEGSTMMFLHTVLESVWSMTYCEL